MFKRTVIPPPSMDDEMEMDISHCIECSEMIESGSDCSSNTETNAPLFFTELNWQYNQEARNFFNGWNYNDDGKASDKHRSIFKQPTDEKKNNIKQSQSFFQLAKNICGKIMKKPKTSIDSGLEEITHQMALLRFNS